MNAREILLGLADDKCCLVVKYFQCICTSVVAGFKILMNGICI